MAYLAFAWDAQSDRGRAVILFPMDLHASTSP